MALFWGAFLGLAVWAVTRLFGPVRDRAPEDARELLEGRSADGAAADVTRVQR
jgi:hypothetical protein